MNLRKSISTVVLALSALSVCQSANAGIAYNNVFAGNPSTGWQAFDASWSGDGSLTSLSGSANFSGLDQGGNFTTMTYGYSAQASASATQLKAYAYSSLTGGFVNAANPYYFDGSSINPAGVPDFFWTEANARRTDHLHVIGASGLAYVRVGVHIDGTLSQSALTHLSQGALVINGTLVFNSYAATDTPSAADTNIQSGLIGVSGGFADVDFWLTAFAQTVILEDYPLEAFEENEVDFFNTVNIGTFYGFDVNGNPVDLISVTSSDGYAYDTLRVASTSVPEPESLALVTLALGLVGLSRRKPNIRQ
jgi:hypothetical protein